MASVTAWLSKNWMPIVLFVVCLYAVNQYTANQSKQEIMGLRLDAQRVAKAKADLDKDIAGMSTEKAELLIQVDELHKTIDINTAYIADLEKAAREDQLKIRQVDTSIESLALFVKTFPELARAKSFGMVDSVSPTGVPRTTLSIPIFFTETFVIEHKNLESAEKQLKKYQENEKTYGDVRALRMKVDHYADRIQSTLTAANNECHIRTDAIRDRYINQLEKPRFELPGGAKMVGCAALGAAGAFAIHKVW